MLRSCRPTFSAVAALLALVTLAACSGRISNGKSGLCDNAGYLAARKIAHVRTEVTICGTVARIRAARRTQSGLHLWFYVRVAPHVNARVIADESVLGPLLVRVGDQVEVQGRFFRDRDGFDGIDWTHRVSGTHSSWSTPGFVVINGIEYR
uniref:Lipoprotein n=1 Tax=mine drainage metagenome TaxID=410659 RepID=E6Q5H0_9ZZZZ